jgi:hypothetical protein
VEQAGVKVGVSMAALPALVMASSANPMNMQQAPDHRKGALLCAEIQALIAVMRQNSKWAMVPGYGYGEEELPEDPLLEEFKILRRKVRAMPLPRLPPPSPVSGRTTLENDVIRRTLCAQVEASTTRVRRINAMP